MYYKKLPFDVDNFGNVVKKAQDTISSIAEDVCIREHCHDKTEPHSTVPTETKTVVENKYGKYTCKLYENSVYIGSCDVMPSIRFVDILGENKGNPRCVKVYFDDNTVERAVTSKNDTFNLEHGISICIAKKLLSMICCGNGNAVFNKIVKYGMDVVAQKHEHDEMVKRIAEENEERYKRLVEKKKRKAERRAEAERQKEEQEREEYIKTQVEIQVRAVDEIFKKYGIKPTDVDDAACNDAVATTTEVVS